MDDVRDFMVAVFPDAAGPYARIAVRRDGGARALRSWRWHHEAPDADREAAYLPVVGYRASRSEVMDALKTRLAFPSDSLPQSVDLLTAARLFGWMPVSRELWQPFVIQLRRSVADPRNEGLLPAWAVEVQKFYPGTPLIGELVEFAGVSR